jgi:Putative DNA-binding domain
VPPLVEVQRRLRDAVVGPGSSAIIPLLVGGADPGERLAIHRRHYEGSLVRALLDKFPATTWLIGSSAMHAAASAFARLHPPTTPCIAEYGESFPGFLAGHEDSRSLAYLRWFAELEWRLVHAAIAIERPALDLQRLADHGDPLSDVELVAQPSLTYLASPWPVDDLMKLYLTDAAPEQYRLSAADIWLEICGSRGAFRFDRLESGEFLFREALVNGITLGAAAERALDADESFDVGGALRRFVMNGLATDIRSRQGSRGE